MHFAYGRDTPLPWNLDQLKLDYSDLRIGKLFEQGRISVLSCHPENKRSITQHGLLQYDFGTKLRELYLKIQHEEVDLVCAFLNKLRNARSLNPLVMIGLRLPNGGAWSLANILDLQLLTFSRGT